MSVPATSPARFEPSQHPARRVVLLGASNLTKSIGTVVGTAEMAWGGPVEVLAALGHGRSYGRTTTVLGRTLPGIEPCVLWQHLNRAPASSTAAIVTDIGNDILYGEPVDVILGWVETCLDRLAGYGAETIVTQLPIDNLHTLSRARFTLMRSLLFPRCRLSLETCLARALKLNEGVRQLTHARRMVTVAQNPAWYGFDPVHIRWTKRLSAWRAIMSHWQGANTNQSRPQGLPWRTVYLRTRVPHERHLLGLSQRRSQPAGRLSSGTTVAIY